MKITFTSEVVDYSRDNWQWNTIAIIEHYSTLAKVHLGNIPVRNEVQKMQVLHKRVSTEAHVRATLGETFSVKLLAHIEKRYRVQTDYTTKDNTPRFTARVIHKQYSQISRQSQAGDIQYFSHE